MTQRNLTPSSLRAYLSALIAALLLANGFAFAQEASEEADEEDEALELQDVRVTGSRLSRPPSELSGNLIVLDRAAIRASGELTLARVLRQLPQNINATNETFGSRLNGVKNVTGASTVNLRGLGSESTLILIDGRRIGYSGILGGVTDISTIPISIVDRIEILLDGASAIYGSDAVGGVVNIITRKDYSGVEVDINHTRPDQGGFDETLASVTSGFAWDGGRINLGYELFIDSGLDSSLRESIIRSDRLLTTGQKNTEPGPQPRVYTNFYNDSCGVATAVVWGLDGNIITHGAYTALDPADQARATCHSDITLPLGFMPGDDLNGISLFGEQEWGDLSELRTSLRPEQRYDTLNLGIDQKITDSIQLHANVRYSKKDITSEDGLNQQSVRLHANSPFNPFGRQVTVQGFLIDAPPQLFESDNSSLFYRFGAEGSLGSWTWVAEYSHSEQESDSHRFNWFDAGPYFRGVNSDGVTEAIIATFGGTFGLPIDAPGCAAKQAELGGSRHSFVISFGRGSCTIYGAPPDPINPFGDHNPWILDDVNAGSTNEQTQFEAIVRGEMFRAPGGPIAMVAGFDYREDVLDSFSEFRLRSILNSRSATGNSQFNTAVSRSNQAVFFESLIPFVGADNARTGVQRLSLTLSGRYDSYSDADVEYRQTGTAEGGSLDATDPGEEFTWSVGVVYRPTDNLLLKANSATSFVAPQLNQLLSKVNTGPSILYHYIPNGNGAVGPYTGSTVLRNTGGNDTLTPETAETMSFAVEWGPSFVPGLLLKANWSDTEFVDRISRLTTPIVDIDDLPPTVTYIASENIHIIDDRYINVAEVNRTGIDYEIRYDWDTGLNEFSVLARRAYTTTYDQLRAPDAEVVHDLVTTRDETGTEDATLYPVPEHQTSMQLTWARGGLFMSVDIQAAAKTTRIISDTSEYITSPATNYDLVVGYEFGSGTFFDAPSWLGGVTATLTVNNLTNSFAENSNYNKETGESEDYLLSSFYEWTQGRSYRLSLRMSF